MLDQQSRLSQTQMQLSTGKKILVPSDDPVASARIIDLNQSIKQTQQYQSNSDAARQRLTLEDGLLQSATTLLQRINELGIQGLSGTSSPSNRTTIAAEMEGLNQQLLGLANTKNANGEYIFSGFKSATPPFTKNADGSYTYGGDSNQRLIQIGETRQITDGDPGSNVFGTPTDPVSASVPPPGSITN
ncbi:MAG: flagellar hook-associated protein FlgL, partial [Hyphomicrobium sp.]